MAGTMMIPISKDIYPHRRSPVSQVGFEAQALRRMCHTSIFQAASLRYLHPQSTSYGIVSCVLEFPLAADQTEFPGRPLHAYVDERLTRHYIEGLGRL